MRLQHLDLNLLVSLHALLTECNVSTAAERVNLSQSAMSHALARLRLHFSDELLKPTGRTLVLTARAQALVAPVREALIQIERIMGDAGGFDKATSTRHFSIQASDYALNVAVAQAVGRMKQDAPGVVFQLSHLVEPASRLVSGEADLIILPQQLLSPEHPSIALFEDEYVVVVWSGSTLAQQDIDVDRYFEHAHIAINFRSPFTDSEAATISPPRARRITVSTHSFNFIPRLLVGTDLIATLPRRQAMLSAASLPLTIKPLPFATHPLRECAQWSKWRRDDAGILWVLDNLRACVHQA